MRFGSLRAAAAAVLLALLSHGPAVARQQSPAPEGAQAPAQEGAQAPADAQAHDAPPADDPFLTTMPLQRFRDPGDRYSFAAPAQWGRLPSETNDEVVFQNEVGDNIRISVAPLSVETKKFLAAYVDAYMKILSQTFADVRFLGQRPVLLSGADATDYVFSAAHKGIPVVCHQVVLLRGQSVLYVTFAGYGNGRRTSEVLFQTSLLSFWLSPSFGGGASTATLADPNAPAFVLPIPDGWEDEVQADGNIHMFRPPNPRPTSAFIHAQVAKAPSEKFTKVDDAFVAEYAQFLKRAYPADFFELKLTRRVFLGGEAAVRFDYVYVSNTGIRRAILAVCPRGGYVVGIACDSAEQGYAVYERAFENLLANFKFKK
jgi:hypothetical protein